MRIFNSKMGYLRNKVANADQTPEDLENKK